MKKASFSTNLSSVSPVLSPSTPTILRINKKMRAKNLKNFKNSGIIKQSARKGKRREGS